MQLVKFNQDTSLQKIKASFLDDTQELTPKQLEVKERIRFAFTLRLKNRYSPNQAVELLHKEYGCSQATAYRLYNKAMYVFGEIDQTDLKAEKKIIQEHKWNLYQLALKDRNVELANKILEEYHKMFDFSEKEAGEEGKLKAHQYNVVINKATKKIIDTQLGNTGGLDFNSFPDIEDITFKEVTENGKDES